MGAEGVGVLARPALRHDPVERVSVACAAVPRRGSQLHDGGASGGRRLDPDAQVRRRDRAPPDRDTPRHPRAVRADHVRADAQAARGQSARRYDVSSLSCVIHAAAPCPVDVKHRMMEWFGPIIHEYYGGTEGFAGTIIDPEEWLAHPGSVGKPFSPVHVVGEDGTELAVGESGELYFEGGPAFEYFKDPEKTASVSNDRGWRSLGDMGYVDEDGYLYLTDRSTFMIVSGGVNIYPQEAENLLVMHPETRRRRGVRGAQRRVRRGGQGRRATGRRRGDRAGTRVRAHRVLPGEPRHVQVSAHHRVRLPSCHAIRTASSTNAESGSATGRAECRASYD